MQICFASNNENKVKEIRSLLGGSLALLSLSDAGHLEELEETAETLEGNAIQKAKFVYEKFKIPCFADDTGLEVETLKGAPGVYSARYAGAQKNSQDNMTLLLKKLDDQQNRIAQFKTVIAYIDQTGTYTFTGLIKGHITNRPVGEQGFGYDPIFIPEGSTKTFGQMTMVEKNQFSHRAKATAKLISFLKERFH